MHLLGVALGILGILTGVFFLSMALAHRQEWVQKIIRKGEEASRNRKAEGYKVDISAPLLWFLRTPLRTATYASIMFAIGIWFLATAPS